MQAGSWGRISRRAALAGGAAAWVFAARRARAQAGAPLKIGYAMPRTGYLGVASPVAEQAYLLWGEQVNAAGGLAIAGGGRRRVEFIAYDDQSEPSKTAEIYEKLISDDTVDLLLAPYGTPFHIAIAPVIERNRFPVVAAATLSSLLRDMHMRHMWFAQPLPDAYGVILAEFLTAQQVKTASVLTLQLPASLETRKYLLPQLARQGITVALDQDYPNSTTDMTGMVSAVKQAHADAVIGLSYPQDSVLYVGAARELGVNTPVQLLLIGPGEPFFVKKFARADLEGLLTIGEWTPDQTRWPRARAFNDAYVARWKEPPDYLDSTVSYASCEILAQAVAQVGLDHDAITAAMDSITFDTVKGPIKFRGVENISTQPGLLQFQSGALQIVWPPDIATAHFRPKSGWSL